MDGLHPYRSPSTRLLRTTDERENEKEEFKKIFINKDKIEKKQRRYEVPAKKWPDGEEAGERNCKHAAQP